ncbi:MAG: prohibitin family protein [Bacteroidetes bacterium]|nr:MAG: prohibitin family protein [Bacteroidota bacterium]MBL1144343.1 prohibitin family protein [Bacteroidota bacterium]NOG57139.1 prohibitin family protein [Bacteroidota bacterium]
MSQFEQPSIDPSKLKPYIFIGVAIVILLIFFSKTFVILQPTERAVIFKKYTSGLDVDDVKGEGLNIVAPWNDVIIFQIQEQQVEETMDVLSKDGLSISLDVSLRFRPEPEQIGYLYRKFRTGYIESLIRPELRSAVRQIIGQYTPEELYATKRQEIETKIEMKTREILETNNIQLKALLFRSIKLPLTIKNSIEAKLAADQEAQKYTYLIEKEKKEAERRKIDAEGKAEANKILSASITDNILREKGISATEELAKSSNSKIIVIGGGGDGLPIILNGN